jgi:hypothetical protein
MENILSVPVYFARKTDCDVAVRSTKRDRNFWHIFDRY